MPKISVVIASFNHAPFVRQAVESALTQDAVDLEVVVTDDGSRDGTVAAIEAIGDPRIRLHVFPENQGACVALNDAIGRAGGEYVSVLNSDDYFLPGKLARQAAYLDEHPGVAAVFALPQFVDERGRPFENPRHVFTRLFTADNRSRPEWLRQFLFQGNCLCHPTLLIRRRCYERIGLLDPLLMQLPDLDLWIRLCSASEIHVMAERLTAFRILDRERNTSAPSRERLARAAWETARVLRQFARLRDEDLRLVLKDAPGVDRAMPLRVQLATAAIAIGKPGYTPFGLDLLYAVLREQPGIISNAEYFRLVGAADPFGAEYLGREFQLLRRSRLRPAARAVLKWFRSRNLRG